MSALPAQVAVGHDSWTSLVRVMSGCVACPLAASRRQVVPGGWPPGARLLLVGEAPGAAEDAGGVPFVGRSGQLLDQLLAEAGVPRAAVAVCNVVKCRPPGNRTPRRLEVETCRGWLDRQVELIDPAVIVSLGATAAAWALGPGRRLADVHGTAVRARGRLVVPTYHPAAAIRSGPAGVAASALRADLATVAALLRSVDG